MTTTHQSPRAASARSQRTRAAIHEAASHAFADNGFAGSSMDEIADRAGVTKPTVYAHGGSKEDLFFSTLRGVLESLDTSAPESAETFDQAAEALTSYAHHRIDSMLAWPTLGMLRAAAGEGIRRPEWAMALMESLETSNFEVWLDAMDTQGVLQIPNSNEAAELFWSQLEGALFFPAVIGMRSVPTERDRGRVIESSVAMFMAMYAADPDHKPNRS